MGFPILVRWYLFFIESGLIHYSDVTMSIMTPQITGNSTVCATVYLGKNQRKHQIPRYWSFLRGIYRWPVDSGPVTRKAFSRDVIMLRHEYLFNIWAISLQPAHPCFEINHVESSGKFSYLFIVCMVIAGENEKIIWKAVLKYQYIL